MLLNGLFLLKTNKKMKNPLIMSLICALVWGLWPILANYSKASSVYISIVLTITTSIFSVVYFYARGENLLYVGENPDIKMFLLPMIAGILNGVGMVFYSQILSGGAGLNITKYVVIVTALIPVVTVVAGYFLLENKISKENILGLVLVLFGIYFVNKK